ncbi:MAG: beta-1,6-N-acetylglucosaminyltransferase [Cyclobacteriaceae bacterium]|nr:beta-1,6-N-acetylglucosaminyltransferase [Cyclobacteriaceae bacterium]
MIQNIPMEKRAFNGSTSAITKQPNIAYFILVHRFPRQFKRLFKAIYHPENHYLIHIDIKADQHFTQKVKVFLDAYPNAYVMESENVVWGGYSMVQSELNGMKYLITHNLKWDFFINLSGQDFPLKSQDFILNFLSKNKGKNFIKTANQAIDRPDTINRIENYFMETAIGFSGVLHKRPFMKEITSYIGEQWMILTRACCEFICNSPEVKKFEDFYRNTLIADESFFQTVLMNSSFSQTIVNDDKRAIIWIPDGGIKLRPKTLTESDLDFLLTGDNLFARKFDEKEDALVLDILESTLSSNQTIYNNRDHELIDNPLATIGSKPKLIDRQTKIDLLQTSITLK